MHYVYLLRSLSHPDQKYVGVTEDLKKRVAEHNSGQSTHTAKFMPWELVGYDAGYYVKSLIGNMQSITDVLYGDKVTLLHGDLRLDNILFEKYTAKYFLDWQMMAMGSPMVDIAYFISQSGTPECQEEVKDYALGVYAKKIYNGDLERMKQEYRNALLLNLSTPIFAALGDMSSGRNIREIITESFSRAMTHLRLEV